MCQQTGKCKHNWHIISVDVSLDRPSHVSSAGIQINSDDHSRSPGVGAADYVSIKSSLPLHTPFKNGTPLVAQASEIAQEECGRAPVTWWRVTATRCSRYMQCLGCINKYSNIQRLGH